MHQKKSQKTECERSLDNPPKWRICISCGRWFSKIITERLRVPRTHSGTGIHREERISAENLKAIGKSFDPKNKRVTQKLGKNFGLFKDTSFIVIFLNREFNLRAKRRIIPDFQDFFQKKKKLLQEEFFRCGSRIGEKPKRLRQKQIQLHLILQGKDGILYFITIVRTNSSRWKDLKKNSSPNFLWRWMQAHVVSSRGTAYLWDKNSSSKPENPDTLKYGPGKKEEKTSDDVLLNASRVCTQIICAYWRNRESRMVQTILEICLSETLASGNREYVQKIFHPKQCWFQMQRHQWKRNERRS